MIRFLTANWIWLVLIVGMLALRRTYGSRWTTAVGMTSTTGAAMTSRPARHPWGAANDSRADVAPAAAPREVCHGSRTDVT